MHAAPGAPLPGLEAHPLALSESDAGSGSDDDKSPYARPGGHRLKRKPPAPRMSSPAAL
jgi:hypothetical protein